VARRYRKAADAGNTTAMNDLRLAYANGSGVGDPRTTRVYARLSLVTAREAYDQAMAGGRG